VLSDPDKKSKYDKFGGDPESRFSGASASGASPFSGFASQRAPRGGGAFGGPFGGFGEYTLIEKMNFSG
jgi:DnaJ family protein B protein 12